MIRILISFLVVAISGCGGTPVKKETLVPVANNKVVFVKDDVVFHVGRIGTEYMKIKSGNYQSVATDNKGMYYIGPPNCLGYYNKSDENFYNQPCGLYIENENSVIKVIELPDYSKHSGASAAASQNAQYGAVGMTVSYGLQSFFEHYDEQRIYIRDFIVDKKYLEFTQESKQ